MPPIIKNCNFNLAEESDSNNKKMNAENLSIKNRSSVSNSNSILINKSFSPDSTINSKNNDKNIKKYSISHTQNNTGVNNQSNKIDCSKIFNSDEKKLSQNTFASKITMIHTKGCRITPPTTAEINCNNKDKDKETKQNQSNSENYKKKLLSNENEVQVSVINSNELMKTEHYGDNNEELNNQKKNLYCEKNTQNTETEYFDCDNNGLDNKNDAMNKPINRLVRPTKLAFFQNFPSVVCNKDNTQDNTELIENQMFNQNKHLTPNLDTSYSNSSSAAAALLRCCQLNSAASSVTTLGDIGSFCCTTNSSPYSLSAHSEPDTPITNNSSNALLTSNTLLQQQRTNSQNLQQNDSEQTTANFLYPYHAYGISPSSFEFNMLWSAPWNFAAAVNATNPITLPSNDIVCFLLNFLNFFFIFNKMLLI